MKKPINFRTPTFDANAINETIRNALSSAGLNTTSGPMRNVTDIIERALNSSALPMPQSTKLPIPPDNSNVIDVVARVVGVEAVVPHGSFKSYRYTNHAGTRAYKLYVPARTGIAPPLLVMLHGCTQSADDFAAGTQMNALADEHGFLVVYPEQASSANKSKCWNWFNAKDQSRDGAEPSLIVGIVSEVAAQYEVDKGRIFVAGMSAGAAMAVILGQTYPEVFAAIGAHSGLPYRSAHDLVSAMSAMKGGRTGMPAVKAVPTIVFHGDLDQTVRQINSADIAQQACDAFNLASADLALHIATEEKTPSNGRSYTLTSYVDATGLSRIEIWSVHGAGHAWSGGSASGSYTDVSGPDASSEMVRFFGLKHGRNTNLNR